MPFSSKSKGGETALMKAIFFGQAGALQALLEAGADPFIENNDGMNAV